MNSSDILIRKVIKEDYQPLMELYNLFVGDGRYSKHTSDSFNSVLTNSSNRIFVAEREKVVIGFAAVSFRRVVRYPKPIAELDELFVKKEQRKMGVGKLLLNVVINEAKKRDCYRVYIESAYTHKEAHMLYEKNGFTNYGYHFFKNL